VLGAAAVAHAQLSVEPVGGLSFTVQGSGVQPIEDFLKINSTLPTNFTVNQDQVPWVTLYDTANNNNVVVPNQTLVLSPSTLGVRVNPANLPNLPGTYQGTIFLNTSGSVGTGVPVPMKLTVLGPPSGILTVSPSSLSFNYQLGGGIPLPQTLFISTSTSAAVAFGISAVTTSGGPWLSVSANSAYTPATATVAAIPLATMSPGVYNGTVTIYPLSTSGPNVQVPVTLVISAIGTLVASPTSLTFNSQTGGVPAAPQTVTVVSVTGGNVPYTVSASTTAGGNWLSASTTASTTPSSFLVSVSPGPLQPGTYYGAIRIFQSGSTSPSSQIPVTLVVSSASQLVASPTALTFNYLSGGTAPPSQFISVTSTGVQVTFNAGVSGPSWITVGPSTGTTPLALVVNANPPSGVAAGIYTASILISPTTGTGSTVTVPVTVNVTASNFLTLSQSTVAFSSKVGGTAPAPEVILVTSSGSSIHFDAVATASGPVAWLKASPSSQYTPGNVTVTANPQGLVAGTYYGTVSIVADAANNSPQAISVTLTVTNGPTFSSNPFGMSFAYQIGFGDPPFQAGVISSQGTSLPYSVSTTTSAGAWLIAAGSGSTAGTIISAVNPNALNPGTYSGSINIQPSDPTIQPLQVPVVLNVAAGPVFQPAVNQLSFQYQLGAPAPQSQSVSVAASGHAAMVYYPTTITSDGGQWLKVAPSSSVTPANITVSVDPTNLTAGVYYGVIVLNDAAAVAPAGYIPVSLQVSSGPILTVAGQLLTFNASPGGSVTPAQHFTVGGGGSNYKFHIDSSNSWLQASPVDGTADATISVTANPAGVATGYYVGLLTVSIPGVKGSEQYVPVVFIVQ
jgi:hypothetical protein